MSNLRELLTSTADRVADYRGSLAERRVAPVADLDRLRAELGGPLPAEGADAGAVLDELAGAIEPALMSSAGPRFFGFVVGGSLDAAVGADILTTGWDQLAFNGASSPAAALVEEIAGAWLKESLGLPADASFGIVTGTQAGNTVGLAAARHRVLERTGWDVERRGLHGAPRIRVVAGEERHATIDRSLRLLGIGVDAVQSVPTGPNGAVDPDALVRALEADPDEPTIVCAQAGNVNTGAFDDLLVACEAARRRGAWVHVDGAFGLWAAASRAFEHLVAGREAADSWVVDGHKWLNLPYDAGFVFCADPDAHAASMSYTAAYLVAGGGAGPGAGGLRARVLPPRAGVRDVGRAARARPRWARRPGRALLRARATLRGAAGGDRGRHDRERRRAQPGPGGVRRRRAHRPGDRGHPARGHLLDGRHDLAREPI